MFFPVVRLRNVDGNLPVVIRIETVTGFHPAFRMGFILAKRGIHYLKIFNTAPHNGVLLSLLHTSVVLFGNKGFGRV
jgi:hypothetical protein